MRARRTTRVQTPDDRTQHTVHRLEAFSDVVMGFCLAQLGLNLVLPNRLSETADLLPGVLLFIAAFAFIALLWWLHHRTFSTYFVLNTPMVVMNFAMLCALVITLYFFESVLRVPSSDANAAIYFHWFAWAFALVYALIGAMLLLGVRQRFAQLPPADIRWGIGQLSSIAIAVLFFVFAGTYAILPVHRFSIGYAAIVTAAVAFVVRRVILPRWLRKAIPDTPVSA